MSTERKPDKARRDPHGRRRAIVKAAAELIVEHGPNGLTHRQVATRAGVPLGSTTYYFASLEELNSEALRELTAGIDADLADIARQLEETEGDIGVMAEMLHAYLSDRTRLQTDAAIYMAAVHQEALRSLALRWFDGLTAILASYTDRTAAEAAVVFLDGAFVHAMLHDEPLDAAALRGVLTKLLQYDTRDGRA